MFNIEGLMGKLVSFGHIVDDIKMGVVVGGYLDIAPNGKRNVMLLVNCEMDGVWEAQVTDCAVQ